MRIEQLCDRIEYLLEQRKWSGYKLAQECKLSSSTIYDILNGNVVPTLATLQSICDGLNVTLGEFFGEDDSVELVDRDRRLITICKKLDDASMERVTIYAQGIADQYSEN